MSYILDALRRADAERERGAVPTLHAQPAPAAAASDADADAPRAIPPWLWIALGLLLAAMLAFAWKLLIADARQDATTAAGSTAPKQPAPATPSGVPPTPTPPPVATQFPTQALSEITPAPPPRPAAAPKEQRPPLRTEARAPMNPPPADVRAEVPVAAATTPAPRPAATGSAAPSGAAEERIYAIAELPDDIRRGLPALPIGGSTYSQNPASRMLIVNGQVFREGDAITPDLKLEQIRLKGAVLRFRNYRYAINF